ncbi:hypothetical protein ABAC402_05650 [Asticcacaulis sp. AC402]|nr:hypothetical protein ABAC402_05650 [Asticcacaulis sp. AC402]
MVLADICQKTSAKTVICSRTFEPKTEERDCELENALADISVALERHNTAFFTEPGTIKTKEGKPYRVYTPFFRAVDAAGVLNVDSFRTLSTHPWPVLAQWPKSLAIEDLGLKPEKTSSGSDWTEGFAAFSPGESGARKALRRFVSHGLPDYEDGRDRPDMDITSRLSPHLRFGEISPRRILADVDDAVCEAPRLAAPAEKLRKELVWREFNYNILHQQPQLHERNFRDDFDGFPWRDSDGDFTAWTRGETGYPLVDAGMKELWRTGFMHNRVRMVCASFLVKHLLIDWRRGEQWFWDCLVDADPANNPGNWQWVAGCGADAAPYFRIFNPTTQADKFDPKGIYRHRHVSGYDRVVDLFDNSTKDVTYPQPIVDHAHARDRALDAYRRRDSNDDSD